MLAAEIKRIIFDFTLNPCDGGGGRGENARRTSTCRSSETRGGQRFQKSRKLCADEGRAARESGPPPPRGYPRTIITVLAHGNYGTRAR